MISIPPPRRALPACAALLLAGCASIPSSGPTARQIVRAEQDEMASSGFALVNLTAATLPQAVPQSVANAPLVALAQSGRVDQVGPGDSLAITVFEVGVTLFGSTTGSTLAAAGGSASAFNPTARAQVMNGVLVQDDGSIHLPYIGRLKVAGLTTSEIEQRVVAGLRSLSQAPQVMVALAQNVHNTVFINGAVAKPGRVALTLAREHLLDAIAQAGGINPNESPENMLIRFNRNDRVAEVYLSDIPAGSAADLLLLPGDRVDVVRRPRTFSVFGAAGRVAQINFPTPGFSLAEAVAQAGGPDDARADPTAVFVFRDTPAASVDAAGNPTAAERPSIYRLDMQRPSGYFLAQRFAMHDKDVIFIANAQINRTRKLVDLFNTLFTPVFTLRAVAR